MSSKLFILSARRAVGLSAVKLTAVAMGLSAMVPGIAAAEPKVVTVRSEGSPVDVAVSVIDNKLATAEKENTIITTMLLTGELRGAVEDAAWYFPDSLTQEHRQAMDALMLTQGWSRYDVPATLSGKIEEVQSELEIGPAIEGVVKSRWMGKPMKDIIVLALAPTLGYAGQAITDENGKFVFTDKDFPDGTKFIFQALNQKGGNESNFDIIPMEYPKISPLVSADSYLERGQSEEETDFDWRIAHSDAIMLGEVLVVQKKMSDFDNPIELMARGEVDYKQIEEKNLRTVIDIVRTIPGIVVYDRNAYYQTRPVSFWVDNMAWDNASIAQGLSSSYAIYSNSMIQRMSSGPSLQSADISSPDLASRTYVRADGAATPGTGMTVLGEIDQVLPADFIKKVQYFPPSVSILLSPGTPGGIVMITTKDGTEKVSRPDWRMRIATPLGYQRKKEFYTPKYELMTDYELNNRPTLYWIPSAKVDRYGSLVLPIPASVDSYTIVAEGIDAEGHPVRITKSL